MCKMNNSNKYKTIGGAIEKMCLFPLKYGSDLTAKSGDVSFTFRVFRMEDT